MKSFSNTDRGRILKKMYDAWVYIGKFELARDTMKTIEREKKIYVEQHKK